jgi:hypothetical protein
MNKKQLQKLETFAETVFPKVIDKLIIDTEYGWLLFAKFKITRTDDGYFTVTNVYNSMKPIRFNKVRNAVTWAILWERSQVYEANRVQQLDTSIGAMEFERLLHKSLKNSKKTEVYLIQEAKLVESIAKQKQFTYELDKYIIKANISQLRGFENELKRTNREQ